MENANIDKSTRFINKYYVGNNTICILSDFNSSLDEYHNVINRYKCLRFGNNNRISYFNTEFTIPINLTGIEFSHGFDSQVVLTPNLTRVMFNTDINELIELPKKLKFLKFTFIIGPILLPKHLSQLTFSGFSSNIVLNKYISEFIIGECTNRQPIKLSKNLEKLFFEKNACFDTGLSKKLLFVSLDSHDWTNNRLLLPKNIKTLILFGQTIGTLILTPGITYLDLYLEITPKHLVIEKPIDMIYLSAENAYNDIFDKLPNGTKQIIMNGDYEHFMNNFPNSVCTIYQESVYYLESPKIPKSIAVKYVERKTFSDWFKQFEDFCDENEQ